MSLVNFSKHGSVAVLTIENPPVNALSPGVPEGLSEGLRQAIADADVAAAVMIGGGPTYIADIK
ncbi:MAG: hypothetical protein JNL98_03575 [Bryobacterales bacterium]|nr:hypothetical protein [Bryobacterales bacterium]